MLRISQLPSLTTADNADEISIVDVSASTTKKITKGDLLKAPLPTDSVTTAAIANNAVTADKLDFTTLPFARMIGFVNSTITLTDTADSAINGTSTSFINLDPTKKYLVQYAAYMAIYRLSSAGNGAGTTRIQYSKSGGNFSNFLGAPVITIREQGLGADNSGISLTGALCFTGATSIAVRGYAKGNAIMRWADGGANALLYEVPSYFDTNI